MNQVALFIFFMLACEKEARSRKANEKVVFTLNK